ncbi:MAG TPA: hypothetical protein VHN99_11580 [Deinococcales bacterium]|nr:hypothetical protein [Deinococcales bacterium]
MSAGYETQKSDNVMAGLGLVALGGLFLLGEITGLAIERWWALFLLVPGLIALGRAWMFYNDDGQRLTQRVARLAIGGIAPTFIGLIFLLNLSWAFVWPIFLVIAGLSQMVGDREGRSARRARRWESR